MVAHADQVAARMADETGNQMSVMAVIPPAPKGWHPEPNPAAAAVMAAAGIDLTWVSDHGVTVQIQLAYWRKANQILRWFDQHVAQGQLENVTDYEVSREQLHDLLATVNAVLKNHDLAPSVLPTVDGFFFGSTNYDEWYFKDLEHTRDVLVKFLADPVMTEADVTFRAWW